MMIKLISSAITALGVLLIAFALVACYETAGLKRIPLAKGRYSITCISGTGQQLYYNVGTDLINIGGGFVSFVNDVGNIVNVRCANLVSEPANNKQPDGSLSD